MKLTKKYEDGSYGVADNLPVGESSYAFKNLLIRQLGMYEHSTLVPATWIPADREVPGILYDWVLVKTDAGQRRIGKFEDGQWIFKGVVDEATEEQYGEKVVKWLPIPEEE